MWFTTKSQSYLFISQFAPFAKHVGIISGVANKLALKESHVEAGGVVVDELEEEHLHRQFVLVLQVSFGDFCKRRALQIGPFPSCRRDPVSRSSPMSVIQTATLSYMRLRIMMMTKLMQEAVTEVAS